MITAFNPDLKSKTFCISKSYICFKEKEIKRVNNKFYQKLFILIFSLSTILIFSESPRELEQICEAYNSSKVCNVW